MWRCLTLLGAALAGCGAAASPVAQTAQPTPVRSDRYGFSAKLPPGWTQASQSLTPHLSNPVEILSAGTFGDMRPSDNGGCAHVPTGALRRMGPGDAFVSVEERFGDPRFPDRPAHFTLDPKDQGSEAEQCAGPGEQLDVFWFGFRDAGRGFHVLVALGRNAAPARAAEALALLDSLRFDPGPAGVALDPDLAIHEDDPAAQLSWTLVPPWHRYDRLLTSLDSERLALGTEREPPDVTCASPSLAADAALILVFEGEPDGCTGLMRRWRDHGRALQAHAYFGSQASEQTRRDAASIVNSIQAR